MIVYGTGSYSLKTFTSSDLNLNPLHYDGHRFKIVQRYAHLFWIPLFPIGREYVMLIPGRSEKYHAPFDVAETMKQRPFPKANALLAFAIPLLLVGGLVLFSVGSSISSSMSQSRYEASMKSRKEEMAALLANPETLRPYAEKVNSMYAILDSNYTQIPPTLSDEMDTSEVGMFKAYIHALSSQIDTIAPMTPGNTYVQSEMFMSYMGSHVESQPDELNGNEQYNSIILNWYREGMPLNDEVYFDAMDVELENEKLDSLKYFALVRYTGASKPFIMSGSSSLNSVFQTGYGMADIYIYDIATKELLGTVSVLAENSEELHFTTNSAYGNSETNIRLSNDLSNNMDKEIQYALRFKERPVETEEELIEEVVPAE
ncbi:MAG: hypothetical protein ACKVOK_08010 [Flavobacteriales bacterium]